MMGLWINGLITRRPLQLWGTAAGIAATIGLIACLALFLSSSAQTMTKRAIANVPIDWQVEILPTADKEAVKKSITQSAKISAIGETHFANVAGLEATTDGTAQTTGPGKVLAFDSAYLENFPAEVRSLSAGGGGVMIAQQTAANLRVKKGDTVTINRVGLPPASVQIDRIVELPDADSLFQSIGLPPQSAPQAPPDNVLILPLDRWTGLFGPQQELAPDSVMLQLHVKLARTELPTNPEAAYGFVISAGHNLEARVAGSALLANNLGARLDAVRGDALYARVLFLFLGIPGILLSIILTFAITASGAGRRKLEQTHMRVRGASMRQVLWLAAAEAFIVAPLGVVGGVTMALILSGLFLGTVPLNLSHVFLFLALAIFGTLLSLAAILFPAWNAARLRTVQIARKTVERAGVSLWQKFYLDVLFILSSAGIFWHSAASGYQVVLATEGVAATAVDYTAFAAPVLFWLGAALLCIRISGFVLRQNGAALRAIVRPISGLMTNVVSATFSRQARRLTLAIGMIAMAVSFATSTSIFNLTFNNQARVDAELTNGSDVTVFGTTIQPAGNQLAKLEAIPGVAAARSMQHRFAYVGADLQDLYGIDPARLPAATNLSNAFFSNGSAADNLSRLQTTPDGVLVSEETVKDFQLNPGDTLNLRLQNSTDHQYHVYPFKFVGVVREFPTAPKDSFLVANMDYITKVTGDGSAEYVLLRTSVNPASVAEAVSALLAPLPSLKIKDVGSVTHLIGSSLTAVDLDGLTSIELIFALIMATASAGLMLALGFIDRRRDYAILTAIGVKSGQLAAFLWSEAAIILLGGLAFGLLIGTLTAEMLITMLTGVFDPPPEAMSIPWLYLSAVIATTIASVVFAVAFTEYCRRQASQVLGRQM
ncbi:FtsX-like permease family protein [Phyllobacterium sp. OV277]|uniref:FtsX-like permease family protein n=1 Tax=Phyllobacterium sp. OV277 TaxID=1882772 RepID=UPI00088E5F73|nr:FtsX-like permease family protein [Phyllobacterium sp. OV277]SDP69631.1 putative ABC transport system permease protein [Phyllobacterium sp. OV277]